MKNRAKEKNKKIDTKDKNILNLDNEIIIGIKFYYYCNCFS